MSDFLLETEQEKYQGKCLRAGKIYEKCDCLVSSSLHDATFMVVYPHQNYLL